MSRLSWMCDSQLEHIVAEMLERAEQAKIQAHMRMQKNVIDPFSSLLIAATHGITDKNALISVQELNSSSSAISNLVGNFHQQVLGSLVDFTNHDSGYDIESSSKKILAEIKNKHNTMNASNRERVIADIDTAERQKKGDWTGYLVIILPKHQERYRAQLTKRKVYEVDGASFYHLATGSRTALHDLYRATADIVVACHPTLEAGSVLQYCEQALTDGIPN